MSALDRLTHLLAQSVDAGNPPARQVFEALARTRTIAVVGLSRDPDKAARRVPSYLATKGYDLIPVNPKADRILGREALDHLDRVTDPVDLVLVFRPSAEAGAVIDAAAARPEAPTIWLQEGIRADLEAERARGRGLTVVQDLCIFKVHRAVEAELPVHGPAARG
ncbi:MAG: CoA-binding protein [Gemmatimonadetes bacterium]|nr:CoA-binding protein [Gemmatimonadota bacterium]